MISIYKDFDNPPKDLLGDNPKITKAVKQALYDLYHGKCAYTEEKIPFEEMEVLHYRPVSLYPQLEFEWSNLLPVCKYIKNKWPNDSFPVEEKSDTHLLSSIEHRKADSAILLAEKSFLLHPEVDTPENHIYINAGLLASNSIFGALTIGTLELNNIELATQRDSLWSELSKKYHELYVQFRLQGDILNNTEKLKTLLLSTLDKTQSFSSVRLRILSVFKNGLLTNKPNFSSAHDNSKILKLINKQWHSSSLVFAYNGIIPYNYQKNITIRPYSVKGITIKRFSPIKTLSVKDIPLNTQWIFLTGENGFGKTLILQAIAQGFWHSAPNATATRARIELELYTYKNGDEYQIYRLQPAFVKQYCCAYGTNRLAISGYINGDTQAPQKLNKTDSLFNNYGVLSNIEEYLINMHGKNQFEQRSKQVKALLMKLLPNIAAITIDNSQLKSRVNYQEKAADETLMPPVSFGQLSAGSKSIIAMIGDMVIDLLEHQNVEKLSDLYGIVLIDEIDAHLHPKWQKEFVRLLTELFPKIQFIASTHSPIPLLGAPRETVILNVNKPSKREGVTVQKLDIDVTQLTPNTILSSPIFGFEPLDSVESKRRIYTQTNYDDLSFEKELKNRLKTLADDDDLSKYIIDDSNND